ncbi:MAG: hypothetical protein Q7R95_10330 [bacterium]|nr:hypothetical protein [bacterium]
MFVYTILLSLKDYFIDQKWGKEYLDQMKEIKINNFDGIIRLIGFTDSEKSVGYFIKFGTHIADFQFIYDETNEKFEIPPKQIFDQILSTFKTL